MPPPLNQSRAYWDAHAQRDPLWAILSEPSRKDAGWDVEGFFQTGVAEVAALIYELDSRGIRYDQDSVLDFGCGVGRLSQALASHFRHVVGIDVSPRMVHLARQLNRHGDRVSYIANDALDLQVAGEERFDVLVTQVVLQHIDPEIALCFFAEFFRVTRRGGLIVFQWPSHHQPPVDTRTGDPRVMPDEAYRMAIRVAAAPTRPVEPGVSATIDVEVANVSPIDWIREVYGAVSAGNHWTDAGGRMIQRDDGRAALPPLAANERCRLRLTVTAPLEPGLYHCEIDLAHEGVLWFSDRGAMPTRVPVWVGTHAHTVGLDVLSEATLASVDPASGQAPRVLAGVSLDAPDPGEFPMHGRPRVEVEQLIAAHGGTLLHVEPDRSCGADWVSYRYYVRNGA